MGDGLTVAAVQMRWKRYPDEQSLRKELVRFMRLARDKGAHLALFPELTGLMLAAPLAGELHDSLQRRGGLLGRLLAGTPDLAEVLPTLITRHGQILVDRYIALFGGLAREFGMMVVAGSLLAETDEGVCYRTGVFDAHGSLLGWQAKLHLTAHEGAMASAGSDLTVFDTEWGRLGVLIGHDLLFPELGRALAYRGCVGILNPTLARSRHAWQQQKILASARAQENQLFVAQSFLVGEDDIFVGERPRLEGRSSVLAPVALSPRGDGVLAEVGAEKVEGVVSGRWDIVALHDLWEDAEVRVRTLARGELFHDLLAFDYGSGATIAERTTDVEEAALLAAPRRPAALPVPPPLPEPATALDLPPATTDPNATGRLGAIRSVPIIDSETGLYLGERAVMEGPQEGASP